jgi:hypothetical protein
VHPLDPIPYPQFRTLPASNHCRAAGSGRQLPHTNPNFAYLGICTHTRLQVPNAPTAPCARPRRPHAPQSPTMAGSVRQPIDTASLERYIAAHVPEIAIPLDVKQFGYGQSNPTYQLTDTNGKKYVMRKKPPGQLLSKVCFWNQDCRMLETWPAKPFSRRHTKSTASTASSTPSRRPMSPSPRHTRCARTKASSGATSTSWSSSTAASSKTPPSLK